MPNSPISVGQPPFTRSEQRRTCDSSRRYDPTVPAPTEIFVPERQFPNGYRIEANQLIIQRDEENDDRSRLRLTASRKGRHTVCLSCSRNASPSSGG